ncbi:MAG: esterase/lipase [Polaribacter sp.]|jgi:esterase/lipase
MTPFYFGNSRLPIYGVYHSANQVKRKNQGIVICYPIGHEYNRVHRLFCQSAIYWSELGFDVIRFDYYGTGDSSGSFENANYRTWCENVDDAITELKAISGVKRISLVGCRLGANIALNVYHHKYQQKNINQLILWDPIFNSDNYLLQLERLNVEMLGDKNRFLKIKKQETALELLGFVYSELLRQELNKQLVKSSNVFEGISCLYSADYLTDTKKDTFKAKTNRTLDNMLKKCFSQESFDFDANWGKLESVGTAIKSVEFSTKIESVLNQ